MCRGLSLEAIFNELEPKSHLKLEPDPNLEQKPNLELEPESNIKFKLESKSNPEPDYMLVISLSSKVS